jgi:ribonuclease III
MPEKKPTRLEKKIGYCFHNAELMSRALHHRSFVNEMPDGNLKDNERLEFLGDAVLNLVIGHLLMQHYPDLQEGELSRMRAGLVNEDQLAAVARRIDLGSFLQLGKGEIQSNGHEKNSILANAFEALLAAVYLDGGFQNVFEVIRAHFSKKIESISALSARKDHKSRLQELVQSTHHVTPQYRIVQVSGPDHDKTFTMRISIGELTVEGEGKSKKAAEQDAARKALSLLIPHKGV